MNKPPPDVHTIMYMRYMKSEETPVRGSGRGRGHRDDEASLRQNIEISQACSECWSLVSRVLLPVYLEIHTYHLGHLYYLLGCFLFDISFDSRAKSR